MLHNIWYWAIKVWNWAFVQIIIIKRGLFWSMTYFYMRQTQCALSNLHWNKIIVGSQLTYPPAMQTLIWEYQKYLRYLNPVRNLRKAALFAYTFYECAFRTRLTSKKNEAQILEWTGFALSMNPYTRKQLFSTPLKVAFPCFNGNEV